MESATTTVPGAAPRTPRRQRGRRPAAAGRASGPSRGRARRAHSPAAVRATRSTAAPRRAAERVAVEVDEVGVGDDEPVAERGQRDPPRRAPRGDVASGTAGSYPRRRRPGSAPIAPPVVQLDPVTPRLATRSTHEHRRRRQLPVHVRVGHRRPPGQDVRPDLGRHPGRDPRARIPTPASPARRRRRRAWCWSSARSRPTTYVDFQAVVRDTVRDIGYTRADYGFDYQTCGTLVVGQGAVAGHRPGRGRGARGARRRRRRTSWAPATRG